MPLTVPHLETDWVDEAERRLADLRAGKAREYPASEVFQRLGAAIQISH